MIKFNDQSESKQVRTGSCFLKLLSREKQKTMIN